MLSVEKRDFRRYIWLKRASQERKYRNQPRNWFRIGCYIVSSVGKVLVDGHWEYVGGFWGGRKWIEGHWDSEAYTGLYGQTLAQNGYDKWPDDYHWYNQSWNNQLTFLDAFIFDTLREYGDEKNIYLYGRKPKGVLTVNHYKQNLDGSYSYQSPTNSTATNGGTFFFSNKYTGFTVDSYEISNKTPKIGDTWAPASPDGFTKYSNNLHIRYTRNRYNLAYYNHNGVARETTLLYEASLGDYESYVLLSGRLVAPDSFRLQVADELSV